MNGFEALRLSLKSLASRKLSSSLCILAISFSIVLLVGVERLRTSSKASFESTVSGVDVIVGARSGTLPLLLYSVFRIGNPTNNISWQAYENLKSHPNVDWAIPISLGDSHRGYRVVATTSEYLEKFRYGEGLSLGFSSGQNFKELFDVVLGSDVARSLNYNIGDKIVISHGVGADGFQDHDNLPFTVSGILQPTATPVDRSLHISLEAMEAIHIGWEDGAAPMLGEEVGIQDLSNYDLRPKSITAVFVKAKSLIGIFRLRDEIQNDPREPLSAIMPGVALQELWQIMSSVEKAFLAISFLVFIMSLISIFLAIQSALKDRYREMAILRTMGASPMFLLVLLFMDSFWLALLGVLSGLLLTFGSLYIAKDFLLQNYGLGKELFRLGLTDYLFLLLIFAGTFLASLIPVLLAYKKSLADGLSIKN